MARTRSARVAVLLVVTAAGVRAASADDVRDPGGPPVVPVAPSDGPLGAPRPTPQDAPSPPPADPGKPAPLPDGKPGPDGKPSDLPKIPPPTSRFFLEEGVDSLAAKMAKYPDDVELGFAWEDAMTRLGRRNEALVLVTKRKDDKPNDAASLVLWARLKGGNEGREAIAAAVKLVTPFPEARQALSEIEELEGRFPTAKAAVDLLLKERGTPRDHVWAGFVRERAGDRAGALDAYGKAIALDPLLHVAKVGKALVLVADGKAKDAVAFLEADPKPPSTEPLWPIALAVARRACDQVSAAREALTQAVKVAAADRRALLGVVSTAVRLKLAFAVQAAVDEALAKAPEDPDWLAAKAVLLLEAQSWPAALAALAEASRLLPKDARLRFLAGIAELRSNHNDKALAHFKAAANLAPDVALYALGVAHVMDRKGAKDVLAAWRRVSELDPKDPEPHTCAALWLYAKGRPEEAAAELETAIKLAPTDPLLRYYLAILHGDRLGMLGLALDDLREYKRLGGTDENALAWLEALEAMGR